MKNVKKGCKKYLCFLVVLSFVITSCLMGVTTVQASSTTQSFNTSTGAMNVDYAGYLSKHDLVFNSPITDPKQGIMVGNGRVGAQVWNANGLTMQVSGVDDSEQTCFSSGLVNLYSNPGMDTGYTTMQQRLSLYNGTMTTQYDSNRTVTIMGSPNSEVMGIHVDDSRTGVSSVSLDLSIWDVSTLTTNGIDVPDINTWKTVTTFVDPTDVGFSRGQTDANHFGYTMAATVDGATFTTQSVNSNMVRLNITPSSSYTIWIACASRINAPNYDSVTQAKNLINSVKTTGYATTLTNYENWWHNFWGKSFVQYSNASGDADYMENMYYLSTYIIAAGSYGTYPFHFINGVFSGVNDDDAGHWSFAYWYWNQRDVYNSFLASNHADVMNTFNNEYSRILAPLKAYTMTRFGIDGLWAPETMRWDGSANNNTGDYTVNIMSSAAEAAQNMYLQYKYTNDANYLSNTAYPFMKEVAKFYAAKLSYNSTTGKYYMASSNAHETYWNVSDAITDLAAVRALFPNAIAAAQKLGVDSSFVTTWQNVLNNLDAYPIDPNNSAQYYPYTPPAVASHNNENVVCELLWPYGVSGIGASDVSQLTNNWNNRPYPYGNVWSPDAIQAARLGMGDNVYNGMKTMLSNYQNYPNGRTTNTNGEFEYMGVHLSSMNEALLQSYNDKIRVFPAMPSDTNFVSKFTLLAKGGFLVSSEKEANDIKYVGINSLYGNPATVENPWGTTQVQVRRVSDNAIITTTSSSEFTFNTTANTVYVIERTSKLLSSYTYTQLTGTANQDVKSLSGTNSKLGQNSSGNKVTTTTFYQDTNFGGTAVTLAAGNYTTAQMTAAGLPDNWASSIRVPAGYTIQAFDADNFGGTEWTFTADNPDFTVTGCNDMISSVKIIAGGGGSGTKYEAESGTLSGGATVGTDHTGYSGTGFVEGFYNSSTAQVLFNVNAQTAGSYNIDLRYSAGNGTNTNTGLYVNGTKIKDITCNATTDWNTWADETETVTLNAGNNTIAYKPDAASTANINPDDITVSASTSSSVLEAENAALSGGAAVATDHTGYSGTGFVDGYFNVAGADTKFTVNASSAGNKTVTLRYSAGGGTSTNVGLYVNGTKIKDITCPGTTDWNTWATEVETLSLNSGSNTIEYKSDSSSSSCINLDNITIQ